MATTKTKKPERTKLALDEEIKTLKFLIHDLEDKITDPKAGTKSLEFQVTGAKPLNPNYNQRVYGKLRLIAAADTEFLGELLPVLRNQLNRLIAKQEENA